MTLGQLLQSGKKTLKEAGIQEYDLDAWYLLEYIIGCSRSEYFLHSDREVDSVQMKRYEELIQKRSLHIPLQHLTGTQEFMGLPFYINEHVLIPRQDTEILVEEAMKYVHSGMKILDMCTGSGCILLSILKLVSGTKGTGADISPDALLVAEENRSQLHVQAELLQSDLFENITGTYDCILSNPPYIPSRVVDTLMEEVRDHEPRMALDGKEDGLHYYRKITEQSPVHLMPGGMLFFEIGYDQAEAVCALMEEKFTEICVVKDLSGLDRVVYGRLKS